MVGETASTQTEPAPEPAPEEKKPEKASAPKKGGWSKKIPPNVLLSPGGMILIFFAIFMEILDIFIPGGALTIEIIPEIIFIVLLAIIAKVPLKASIIPLLIERIPLISDILPTWVLRMLM